MTYGNHIGKVVCLLFIALISCCGWTQNNSIQLLNGKTIEGKVTGNDGEFLTYEYLKKKNHFVKEIDLLRVFSFTKEGEETIVYKQDTSIGNVFSQEEMQMFIYGERDSQEHSKSWPFLVSGFVLSYGISIVDTYSGDDPDTPENETGFFRSDPSMMHFAVPFVFPIVCGKIRPKITAEHVSEDVFLANEQYIIGYQKNARFKRIMAGFIGSIAGSALGIVTYSIAKS